MCERDHAAGNLDGRSLPVHSHLSGHRGDSPRLRLAAAFLPALVLLAACDAEPLAPADAGSDPFVTSLGARGVRPNRAMAAVGAEIFFDQRNLDKRASPGAPKSYMHNGAFKSLEEVVHFYNTRDALPTCAAGARRSDWGIACWPRPEVEENLNVSELGNLGLTPSEEAAVVAFLRTLSDGWRPGGR